MILHDICWIHHHAEVKLDGELLRKSCVACLGIGVDTVRADSTIILLLSFFLCCGYPYHSFYPAFELRLLLLFLPTRDLV